MKRKHKRHGLPFKRARQSKTDYHVRLRLLSSGKTRFVARTSDRHVSAQFIAYHPDGDKVIIAATSQELVQHFGWKGSCKNISAAYLVGLLAGIKAKGKNITTAVFDIGLQRSIHGGVLYAVLKGAIDAGIVIPADKEAFPTQERIEGKHLKESFFTTVQVNIMKTGHIHKEAAHTS